jgi:peptidoglycan/LPS O-acetylase OafA/YrhL
MVTDTITDVKYTGVETALCFQRIPAFDFTKGALVLFMVLYHWLNYFYGTHGEIYKYLRFLTPSFTFITGFLISHVHFSKYGVASSKLSKRLFFRGLKLLAVFVVLNLVVSLLEPASFVRQIVASRSVLASLDSVFFTAKIGPATTGKLAAFGILVPISYLLMLSAVLSLACRSFKYSFHLVSVILLLGMVSLGLNHIQSGNLELVSIGIIGVAFGCISREWLHKLVSSRWLILSLYCIYLTAITLWDVSIYAQMAGAALTTALLYTIGMHIREGRMNQHLILLGRYSLLGYIAQIAILQLLHGLLRHTAASWTMLAGSLAAGFVLTMLSVEAVNRVRARSRMIDRAYRVVFV